VAPAAADQTLGMALMSAAVNSAGTLLRGTGAVSASRSEPGIYAVVFNRDIVACIANANVGNDGNTTLIPYAVSLTLGINNQVLVRMDIDRPFYLLVFCHQ
jgi:hypothetical protein